MKRRNYKIDSILINGKSYSEVIIDSHYELKHSKEVNDELILSLVQRLNGKRELPVDVKDGFNYYVTIIDLGSKTYRLIWLLEDNAIYIGVVNAFRDRKGV